MRKNSLLKIENYFELFTLLFFIISFVYIIKDFIVTLFLSSIFVFFTFPLYKKLLRKLKVKSFSAIIVIIIVLIVVFVPIYFLSLALISQSQMTFENGVKLVNNLNLYNCSNYLCDIVNKNLALINPNIDNILNSIILFISNSYLKIFNSISEILLKLFIFLLAFYFLLIDGEKFIKYLFKILPMKNEYKKSLFLRFEDVSKAIFFETIFIALIQGFLVGFGFYIFKISSPVLWGFVASFFALLPMIGTAMVWLPASIYFLFNGEYIKFILFFAYGMIIVSLTDNLLQPLLLNKKIKVHPFLILLTILGGISLWGFIGLFIGPIIISILITLIQLYKLDFN